MNQDSKKEDFRKYLDRNGVVDVLTKVLVGLYEETEKPENPLEYLKTFIGGNADSHDQAAEIEELKAKIVELTDKIEVLQVRSF